MTELSCLQTWDFWVSVGSLANVNELLLHTRYLTSTLSSPADISRRTGSCNMSPFCRESDAFPRIQ